MRRWGRQALARWWSDLLEFLLGFSVWFWAEIKRVAPTLPLASRLLSRAPNPPTAKVQDVRAKRIRLSLQPNLSSIFNEEELEVEWRPLGTESWTPAGKSGLPQRTVARLQPDTEYDFRVRAVNRRGASGWAPVLRARTKLEPLRGGGHGPGFTWEQTPTDVTISFELPPGTTKRNIKLDLGAAALKVELLRPQGEEPVVLLEGPLFGRVKSLGFEGGSFWELVKEGSRLMLHVTLEKAHASVAPKFDYWRSVVVGAGHNEVDTHCLSREDEGVGLQMVRPGQLDPVQMRHMGVKGF